jgi:hypothetical protein
MSSRRLISISGLARLIGVHQNTLSRYLKEHGIRREYSRISNNDLDDITRAFKTEKPESGLRYLAGFLQNSGLRVQDCRIRSSMKRVDALGQRLQERKVARRRKYETARPNSRWHLDGHHKLIRWGIVIHGFIDGYCRTVSD